MLEIRPNCECCDQDLVADEPGAYICSFECTFCRSCAEERLALVCPNCGGALVKRPTRSVELLRKYPASVQRTAMSRGCPPAP